MMPFSLAALLGLVVLVFAVACGSDAGPSSTQTPMAVATRTASSVPSPSVSAEPLPLPAAQASLVIINGTIIDGSGADSVADGHVMIADGRISAVGRGQPAIPQGATVVDARGGTIMPGLVDTHVHVARGVFAGGDPSGIDPGGLIPWLNAGMTTLRDVATPPGAFPGVKQAADGQTAAHEAPRVVWAGPMVTAVGGYPFTVPRYALVGEDVASVEEARQVVTGLADGGAGIVKLGLEQGYYANQGWALLSLDVVRAITETAHARGLRVTAHVTSIDEVRLALDGGVDDLAHAPLEPIPEEIMQEMLMKGIGMATTATVWGVANASAQAAANAKRYADAGGVVSIGTDYGCCGQAAGLPPYLQEMEFLRGAGMTPMQLLVAATRNGAIMANVGREVGTLEAGKIADIIVVEGDPLADLQALNNVRVVIQGGVVVGGPLRQPRLSPGAAPPPGSPRPPLLPQASSRSITPSVRRTCLSARYRDFDLRVVGLAGGERLEGEVRPHQDARDRVRFERAAEANDLVRHRGDERDEDDPRQDAQPEVGVADGREHEDADDDDREQEARAAADVGGGVSLDRLRLPVGRRAPAHVWSCARRRGRRRCAGRPGAGRSRPCSRRSRRAG